MVLGGCGYFDSKRGFIITLLLLMIIGSAARLFYANNFPLSGDEAGVGVLQATGQTIFYTNYDKDKIVPAKTYLDMMNYDDKFTLNDLKISLTSVAGMHPPFYYVVIRYFIKYFGNELLALRGLSVLLSILIIPYGYLLGKELHSSTFGLLTAFLLTFSIYIVKYSVMVRPYPFVGFLSILTTYYAIRIIKDGFTKASIFNGVMYIIFTTMGMYSLYHYVFVIVFQFCLIGISFLQINNKSKKKILGVIALFAFPVLFFLPWLPCLIQQIPLVSLGCFYFNEDNSYLTAGYQLFWNLFIRRLRGVLPDGIEPIMCYIAICLTLYGFYRFYILNRLTKSFTISFVLYLAIYIAVEKYKDMNTLAYEKYLFFIVPVLCLAIAALLLSIPDKKLKTIIISLFMLVYSVSVIGEINGFKIYDGPDLRVPKECYSKSLDNGERVLLIINSKRMRYVFSLIHTLRDKLDNLDILYTRPGFGDTRPSGLDLSGKDYDTVFIMNQIDESQEMYSKNEIANLYSWIGGELIYAKGYVDSVDTIYCISKK